MQKKIIVSIGTNEDGNVRARLSLLIMDGDVVQARNYHSIEMPPGADIALLRDINEAHLARNDGSIPFMPWPPIPDDEWSKVERCIDIFQPVEVVEKFQAKMAAIAQAEGIERVGKS